MNADNSDRLKRKYLKEYYSSEVEIEKEKFFIVHIVNFLLFFMIRVIIKLQIAIQIMIIDI